MSGLNGGEAVIVSILWVMSKVEIKEKGEDNE
jgi:hypothetical protein